MDQQTYQRFVDKIDDHSDPDACWLWKPLPNNAGYGRFTLGGKRVLAHRAGYELLVGPIPAGMQLDHLCRVRHCVNPTHLEPVTARENTMRSDIAPASINARKTQCPQGHEYTSENTVVQKRGGRLCRTCQALPRRYRRERAA